MPHVIASSPCFVNGLCVPRSRVNRLTDFIRSKCFAATVRKRAHEIAMLLPVYAQLWLTRLSRLPRPPCSRLQSCVRRAWPGDSRTQRRVSCTTYHRRGIRLITGIPACYSRGSRRTVVHSVVSCPTRRHTPGTHVACEHVK